MSTAPPQKPKNREQTPQSPERPAAKSAGTSPSAASSQRLLSLDAYRGFIMVMMASDGFGLVQLAEKEPGTVVSFLASQLQHAVWNSYTFWDLIQPAFMFMVGVAMPFSYDARSARGDSFWRLALHALIRSVVLVFIGVVILHKVKHGYLFTNVLAQIGLGYFFLFLLWSCKWWVQPIAALAILGAYGWFFYDHPLPPPELWPDYGITQQSIEQGVIFEGEKAPWSKNINLAGEVDRKLLNLLPRDKDKPYKFNDGGYQTLNFVPSLATMIFGLLAGQLLRSDRRQLWTLLSLLGAGAVSMAIGVALDMTILPSVKRIWTPSWVFVSGAWALWFLAAFYGIIEMRGWRRWSMPLVVVGCNSIAIYMMSQLSRGWITQVLHTHLGTELFGGDYGPVILDCSVLAVMWLLCWWLYRQRIFIRI